ncbi:LysM peptidoglycan-binding domain-containing protein [Effusibacillus consociatus]|uniref:LysM peptidoglycan-binding domain-containing protein n=1 Tax=Effusibacillus consociatus TaxID=1117041 RepID=A0ABV9Q0U3_9BACL
MALGDHNQVIRIQVDQRLALESGVVGDLREDATVSTEITYFDRIGDSYILEGILAFSGAVESPAREGEDSGPDSVTPISYRLPFALRLPVQGQPNFLEVNTRIGKWDVQPLAPGFLQLQAELAIQGLNGKNGYSFYCGEQEDWVQPQIVTAEESIDRSEGTPRTNAAAANFEAALLETRQDQEEQGYNEQDWLIEAQEERDEQDTLVFNPDYGWHEQLNSALEQPSEMEEVRVEQVFQEEDLDMENRADQEADEAEKEIRDQEEDYQFEALADEVVKKASVEKLWPVGEPPEKPVTAMTQPEQQMQEIVSAANASDGPAEEQIVTAQGEPMETEPVAAEAPALQSPAGPKLSFGSKKEEEAPAPVKLSGLLHGGSLAKNFARESVPTDDPAAAVSQNALQQDSEPVSSPREEPAEQTGENLTDVTNESSSSIWGNWIQKASDNKFTLKFRIIQEAESLDQIANNYETPIENLMRANGLTNEQVDVGQVLIIPGRRR